MKLYFSPGACSLSPHIVVNELGLPVELVKVNGREKKTATGADYYAINAKGAVPALQLDDGQVLTEGAVIVQYLADLRPAAKLAPAPGSFERFRLQEWLNYTASDLQKTFSAFFNSKANEEYKASCREALVGRFTFVARQLEGKQFLLGSQFTVADAYLFTMLTWCPAPKIELTQWPSLAAYFDRIKARPAVQKSLETEQKARAA